MRNRFAAARFAVLLLSAGILSAQTPYPDGDPGSDPPSRVARLNFLQGPVSFQPGNVDSWTEATLNYPLTTGDHLYTDSGARAEMRIGRNSVRLDQRTNFGFLNLDDQTVQMRFAGGAMEVRVGQLDDREVYEVDTPNGAVSLLRTGDYRIDTDPDRNATMVTVYYGEVEVAANGQTFLVHPRQTAWFSEYGAPDIREQNRYDDFDRFTGERNREEDRMPPPRHVNPQMIGGEDMDRYGTWREEQEYGWVWAPPVDRNWAPYRAGHWAWVEPWGWTWIDEAPWGFAPFHYGRWAMTRAGWVWIPGGPSVRPVYAPALVAFVGGPGFRLGIGIGGGIGAVAWFPLGPREVYRPVYAVSPVYVRNINIAHVTQVNITNVNVTNVRYVNQTVPGAATAVPQHVFVGRRGVAGAAIPVSPRDLADGQIAHGALIAPRRESVIGFGGSVVSPPRGMADREVIVKRQPPPAAVSFSARQDAISRNQGRPLDPGQLGQLRQQRDGLLNRAPVRSSSDAPLQQPQNRRGFQASPAPVPTTPDRPATRFDPAPPRAPEPTRNPDFARPAINRPAPVVRPAEPAPVPTPNPAPVQPPRRFEAPAQPQPPAPIAAPRPDAPRQDSPRPAPPAGQQARPEPPRPEPKADQPRPQRVPRRDERKNDSK